MGNSISFGECDTHYICIYIVNLLASLGLYLSLILADIYEIDSNSTSYIVNKNDNIFLTLFLSYIGASFTFFFQQIMNKCIIKDNNNNNRIKKKQISSAAIKFIFNDNLSEKIKKKDLIYILFFSILSLLIGVLKLIMNIYLNSFNNIILINYFSLILFFSFILSFCRIKYYKHQYYSIIFLFILKIIPFIIQYNNLNLYSLYFVILQIITSFIESIFLMYIKGLMEYKYYFSPYRIMYILGIINSVLILIVYFILSFIYCDYFSFFDGGKKYFINIFAAFSDLNIKKIAGYFLFSIFNGIYNLLIFITINKFTVCHSIILIGNDDLINFVFFVFFSIQSGIIVINVIYFSIIIICFLVFLEYIELNCFGLSKNTKRNIRKRANEDSPMLNFENQINNGDNDDNDDNDNENDNEIKNEEDNNEFS